MLCVLLLMSLTNSCALENGTFDGDVLASDTLNQGAIVVMMCHCLAIVIRLALAFDEFAYTKLTCRILKRPCPIHNYKLNPHVSLPTS
jgi:hypothetical protein